MKLIKCWESTELSDEAFEAVRELYGGEDYIEYHVGGYVSEYEAEDGKDYCDESYKHCKAADAWFISQQAEKGETVLVKWD